MLELRTETTSFRDRRVVEFYERHGDTRTIYRFEFPHAKSSLPSFQQVDVGLKDGYYLEHPRQDMAEADQKLFKTLEEKSASQQVREATKQHVGLTCVETIYFEAAWQLSSPRMSAA